MWPEEEENQEIVVRWKKTSRTEWAPPCLVLLRTENWLLDLAAWRPLGSSSFGGVWRLESGMGSWKNGKRGFGGGDYGRLLGMVSWKENWECWAGSRVCLLKDRGVMVVVWWERAREGEGQERERCRDRGWNDFLRWPEGIASKSMGCMSRTRIPSLSGMFC